MNKQKLLDELNKFLHKQGTESSYFSGSRAGIEFAIKLVEELEEPEKVVIPNFVADWIEEMKQDERPLYSVMSSLMNKTNHEWAIWKSANKNFSEIVAQAWLDGYEVDKERLYRVIIPAKDTVWKYYYLNHDGGISVENNSKYVDSHTEEFIRSISDDLWQFAVEVAE